MGTKGKRLKAFYGWAKLNKVQKKESLVVAFENECLAGDESNRSGKTLRKNTPEKHVHLLRAVSD